MRPPGPLADLYVLDEKKRVHPAPSYKAWKAFWRDVKQRTVAHTVFGPGQYVMTFFTGINHNPGGIPVCFKTLVFGGRKPAEHYAATWPDALDPRPRHHGHCVRRAFVEGRTPSTFACVTFSPIPASKK